MPFNFKLPTTSYVAFQDSLISESHPSLPLAATTSRGVLRNVLKKHKRLPATAQASHLRDVLSSLEDYIPYLLALDAGLSGKVVANEEVSVDYVKEVDTEWRINLTSTPAGHRDSPRVKLNSFEDEILFTLLTLGETHYLLARTYLHTLYASSLAYNEQRVTAVQTAQKHLFLAYSVFTYGNARAAQLDKVSTVADISASTFGALEELCLAEATLVAVLKDDPYPAAVVQDRNKDDKEWMYKAPDIPKVRARIFALLCISAGDHAAKGLALLGRSNKIDEKLMRYFEDLRRAARGKACRFLGIDADLSGQTGEGIGWLIGARKELGFLNLGTEEAKKSRGLGKLKKDWTEKREDKKIEKGADWGSDASRFEEGRVVDMLMEKWERMNNAVNVQSIPPSESLLARMPAGREYTAQKLWKVPSLDSVSLTQMRAPPDPDLERHRSGSDDSDEEDGQQQQHRSSEPVGAFPGTGSNYSSSSYY